LLYSGHLLVLIKGKSLENHLEKYDPETVDLDLVWIFNRFLSDLLWRHVAGGPPVIDRVDLIKCILVFHVDRDAPVCELELDGQSPALRLQLISDIEVNQYIGFFDVQVKHLPLVHLQQGLADLIEDHEGGRLIVGLRVR
jgi:hypothetical protein